MNTAIYLRVSTTEQVLDGYGLDAQRARCLAMVTVKGWDTPIEFNLQNDPMAAMILLDSGVPLVHVPCKNVAEHLRTVPAEIDEYVRGRGAIGDYLADIFREWVTGRARSKPLWDMTTIAYLVNPEWVPSKISQAPTITADMTWGTIEKGRHIYRVAIDAKRDPIFQDFFGKLEGGISC
ncbi:hypothetical protein MUP00_10095 [Candidatus Bathyarchaeota archaeon]|nr:hypothetical protein [Candidatus Bathyarchaeota archaeon]